MNSKKAIFDTETLEAFRLNETERERSLSLEEQRHIHNMALDVFSLYQDSNCEHEAIIIYSIEKDFRIKETSCLHCKKLLSLQIKRRTII